MRQQGVQAKCPRNRGRGATTPAFGDIYSANQIREVAEYIATVLPGKGTAAAKKP